ERQRAGRRGKAWIRHMRGNQRVVELLDMPGCRRSRPAYVEEPLGQFGDPTGRRDERDGRTPRGTDAQLRRVRVERDQSEVPVFLQQISPAVVEHEEEPGGQLGQALAGA